MIRGLDHHELRGHRIRVIAFTGVCFITSNAELHVEPSGYLVYIERAHDEGREIIFDAVMEEEHEQKHGHRLARVLRYIINLKGGS